MTIIIIIIIIIIINSNNSNNNNNNLLLINYYCYCYAALVRHDIHVVHSQVKNVPFVSLDPRHPFVHHAITQGVALCGATNAQLQFLQSRFPMEDGGAVNVQFTWSVHIP